MLQAALHFLRNEYHQLHQLIVIGDLEGLSARFTELAEQNQSWQIYEQVIAALTNERLSTCFLSAAATSGNFTIFQALVEKQNMPADNEHLFIALKHAIVNGKSEFISKFFATPCFQIFSPQELINLLALAKALDRHACANIIHAEIRVPKYTYLPKLKPLIKELIDIKTWIPKHFVALETLSGELIELIKHIPEHPTALQAAIDLNKDISSCLEIVTATNQIPLNLMILLHLQLAVIHKEIDDLVDRTQALEDAKTKANLIAEKLKFKQQLPTCQETTSGLTFRTVEETLRESIDDDTEIHLSALIQALDGSMFEFPIKAPRHATFKQVRSMIAQMAMCPTSSLRLSLEGHEVDDNDRAEKGDFIKVSFNPETSYEPFDDAFEVSIASSSRFTSHYDSVLERLSTLSLSQYAASGPSSSSSSFTPRRRPE